MFGEKSSAAAQGPADLIQHIQAGKLKLLLPLSDKRWPIAPNVPTVLEKYGFFGMTYQSVYGPRGVSEHIRNKLQNAFKNAMGDPSFVEAASTFQVTTIYMSGKDYENLWKSYYDEMGKIIREMGLGK